MSENQSKKPINFLKSLSSLKLTVICLVILTFLVVWGTIYQADHGLYQAQVKFFHSWFFLLFGFLPFPGTVLVMFVLFINLVFSIIYRIKFKLSNLGNLITHLGIIVLLVGGFFTFYFSEESSLMLKEGEITEMSSSRTQWELAIWEQTVTNRNIFAIDTKGFKNSDQVKLNELNLSLTITDYFKNCSAYTQGSTDSVNYINGSGIKVLKKKPLSPENSQNFPGLTFSIQTQEQSAKILLYGREKNPTRTSVNGKFFNFILRQKRIPLPLELKLLDFRVKKYPNSEIVKSFESTVLLKTNEGIEREVIISMNKPLRYKDLTFFQSGYYIDQNNGEEHSIFAVVKNTGRLLPYFSSAIIFIGMLFHFINMLIRRRKKTGRIK